MAWRPNDQLVEGELDNTIPGKTTGWLRFVGMDDVVRLDLAGDFHRDIRGAKICLSGCALDSEANRRYMEGFSTVQTGEAGDITAGRPPQDYVDYPYIEWYSEQNGRVVLELDKEQVEIVGRPIPVCESDPVSRAEQDQRMGRFLGGVARELRLPPNRVVRIGGQDNPALAHESKSSQAGGMTLLTVEIRGRLPALGSQDGLGGKAVAHVKFFTPDSNWTWWATQGGAEGNDYLFFGLVQGHEKELGYFSLSELQSVRGPMGLPIERDLHWTPKTLEEIAPDLFSPTKSAE